MEIWWLGEAGDLWRGDAEVSNSAADAHNVTERRGQEVVTEPELARYSDRGRTLSAVTTA